MKLAAAIALAAAALAAAPEDAAADEATAKKHFEAGRKLMKAGKPAAACAEFAASHRAHASVGALLNLGECNERQNKLASAWRAFSDAAREARDQNDRKRARYARQRIAKLEERLSFIELEVPGAVASLPGLVIELDGAAVDPEDFNRAVAADIGEHEVVATADGYQKFRAELTIEAERSRVELRVELQAHRATERPPPDGDGVPEIISAAPTSRGDEGMSTRRKLALASFVAAAALAGGGTALGLSARSRWNEAEQCETTSTCSQRDVDLADSARLRAHLSTGAFALAAAGAAVGAWLFFTDDESEGGVKVAVEPGKVWLTARF